MTEKWKLSLFLKIAALFFALAGGVHLYKLLFPYAGDPQSPTRHGLFVAINIFCVGGLWKRPWWFKYLFSLLVVQQIYSHGGQALAGWLEKGEFRSLDWAIAVFMPLLLALLWWENRENSREK